MNEKDTQTPRMSDWDLLTDAWLAFCRQYPEVGFQGKKWEAHNFLRRYRQYLLSVDAIRKARGTHWIVNKDRFPAAAFDCSTGKVAQTLPEAA
jgi:hypothetical protein